MIKHTWRESLVILPNVDGIIVVFFFDMSDMLTSPKVDYVDIEPWVSQGLSDLGTYCIVCSC
jgi:hypothetical protein